jgi:hypothetical protein
VNRLIRTMGAACAVVLLVASCSPATQPQDSVVYYPDYPGYETGKDLFTQATAVVEGRVSTQARTEKMTPVAPADLTDPEQNPQYGAPAGAQAEEPGPVVITVRTVEIVKVFKGDLKPGDTVEIKELGGQVDGVSYVEHEATPLVKEKTYALFLQTYPNAPASLLNSQQGKYLVTGASGYASMPGNKITLSRTALESFS